MGRALAVRYHNELDTDWVENNQTDIPRDSTVVSIWPNIETTSCLTLRRKWLFLGCLGSNVDRRGCGRD